KGNQKSVNGIGLYDLSLDGFTSSSHVVFSRVEKFLNEPELNRKNPITSINDPYIGFKNATFRWPDGEDSIDNSSVSVDLNTSNPSNKFTLINLNVSFPVNELSIICGPTGCGKTSLLMALLGEMECLDGHVFLPRTNIESPNKLGGAPSGIAYVSQTEVLRVCALNKDLEILEFGDKTEIGEKGITLSGGQKQRLCLRGAAKVVVMKDGQILVEGSVEEILAKGLLDGVTFEGEELRSSVEDAMDVKSQKSNKNIREGDGRLISEETRAVGMVGWKDYKLYLVVSGGFWYWLSFLLMLVVAEIISVGAEWWIQVWTNAYNDVYNQIHQFATTIWNMETVDQIMGYITFGFLNSCISITSVIIVVSIVMPQFLIAGVFISAMFIVIGAYYIAVSRDLKRGLVGLSTAFIIIFNLSKGMDPGLAGFALIIALNFTEHLIWVIRLYAMQELNMNSRGDIQVKNLVMQYAPDNPPVLKDISFHVQPAEKIGVVAHLIDDATTDSGTSNDSKLSQNEQPQSQITWTLDEPVSENGNNYSQGQRQLIALARALLRKSKLIIMDEATASVDFETDRMIQKTIREEFSDATLLCIAHRLRTIVDYDKILVLDAGRIVEFDHPYILLQKPDSMFRGMCDRSGDLAELVKIAKAKYDNDYGNNYG
ncbi:2355_t:CDS:10, partial [Racocetra fulgida]